jgi:plastocyanin
MKKILLGLLMVVSLVVESRAGSIIGTIHAEGKAGAEQDGATGKYTSRRYKFVERVNYSELGDFVIYIDQTMTNTVPPSKPLQVITQKDAMFSPHVLPVMVGSVVEWPNYDDIAHNVFSMSDAKPFDLGLYKQPTIGRVTFDKIGRVDVFCSIHTRMNCVILVLPNPYFTSVRTQGRY